jgi:hypothetical protein
MNCVISDTDTTGLLHAERYKTSNTGKNGWLSTVFLKLLWRFRMRRNTKITATVVIALVIIAVPLANFSRGFLGETQSPALRWVPALVVLVIGCAAWGMARLFFKTPVYTIVQCANEDCQAHVIRERHVCSECGKTFIGTEKVVARTTKPINY